MCPPAVRLRTKRQAVSFLPGRFRFVNGAELIVWCAIVGSALREYQMIRASIHVHTLIIFIVATSFNSKTSKMRLRSNAKAVKQEVLTKIPIGSSIKAAKNIMENNGFKCEFSWNDSFVDQDENGNKIVRTGMNFLYCNKEKFVFPLIERRWQIIIVHKNEIVSEVVVSISLTGL